MATGRKLTEEERAILDMFNSMSEEQIADYGGSYTDEFQTGPRVPRGGRNTGEWVRGIEFLDDVGGSGGGGGEGGIIKDMGILLPGLGAGVFKIRHIDIDKAFEQLKGFG